MNPVRLLLLLALVWGIPSALGAQQVRVPPEAGGPAVELLREIVARSRYTVFERDTILPKSFSTAGDVLIFGSDVRLEGTIGGDVAVVDGVFFTRPGSRVAGRIASVGSEVLPSGLSEHGEIVETEISTGISFSRIDETGPSEPRVALRPAAYDVRVQPAPAPPRLILPGLFGFRAPAYDRVDGLSLQWGPRFRFTGRDDDAVADAWVTYHSARGDLAGGVQLDLPLTASVRVQAEAARATLTNEEWIRTQLPNTLGALTYASDLRDYRESDFVSVTLGRPIDELLFPGDLRVAPRIALLASDDRSLAGRTPWALFAGDEDWRPNPAIEPGTLVSVTGAADLLWEGNTTSFVGEASVERGLSGAGDFGFTQWIVSGDWEMEALWGHTIAVYARGMGTFGDAAPPQRWSFVGGLNTLPTFETAAFRGDRLAFVRSVYALPVPGVVLPVVGVPTLTIVYAAGTAWQTGEDSPGWQQNLGLGATLLFLNATYYVDPSGDTGSTFAVSLSIPTF